MSISLRPAEPADTKALGEICFRAFKAIAEQHHFIPDFPNAEVASGVLAGCIGRPGFFGVVAELDGRIIGSNFLDERNPIGGLGPITVDPAVQNDGAGRRLMDAVFSRARERGFPGIRLVQAAYHARTLALYLKLGFDPREQLACLQGPAIHAGVPARPVRAATAADLSQCNELCRRIHGHDRGGELADALAQGTARVVESAGRLTGYTTCLAFFGHAVAETNGDLQALIAAADGFPGPGFLVPTRNAQLLRWCLAHKLRITQTMTLMSIGLYNEPQGAWLPSVIF